MISVVCQLCYWKGRSGHESRGWRRSSFFRGPGLSSFLFTTQSKCFWSLPFLIPLNTFSLSDANSYILNSWTNSRGSLWLRELTIQEISSSHSTWHGHSCESSPVNCFTVYPRKPLISFTAVSPPTENRVSTALVCVLSKCIFVFTSAVGLHLCVVRPSKWRLFPIATLYYCLRN